MFTSLNAGRAAPFHLTTPVMIDFSEITLDFDDDTPVVTVAPFTATVSSFSAEAALTLTPFRTEFVTVDVAFLDGPFLFFGTSPVRLDADSGRLRFGVVGDDVRFADYSFSGFGLNLADVDGTPGTVDLFVDLSAPGDPVFSFEPAFFGLSGTGSAGIDPVSGESIQLGMTLDVQFPITLVPEPHIARLLLFALLVLAALALRRRRALGMAGP